MPNELTMEEKKAWKSKYNAEYIANNTTRVRVNLNHKTDADILEYLETVSNKQGLIKELLRQRMKDDGFHVKRRSNDGKQAI